MNKDFVTYDIAVKLKEKGFDELCLLHYTNEQILVQNSKQSTIGDAIGVDDILDSYNRFNNAYTDVPTISQVLKWLREEKKLFVDIGMAYNKYFVGICKTDEFDEVVGQQVIEHAIGTPSNTYEEAAIAGIEYVLNNLI